MAASVKAVRGKPTVFNVSTGFNDIHYFAHHLKIPTLGYGPGGDDIHAVDEKARVSDLSREREDLRQPPDDLRGLSPAQGL
jgi:succinyl-diaminopimelate desuccinylase